MDRAYLLGYLPSRLRRLRGKSFDFLRDDSEPPACLSRSRRFNSGIQGQQVCLASNAANKVQHGLYSLCVLRKAARAIDGGVGSKRSEEHTSELQSLMRISYAVFCLKKKKKHTTQKSQSQTSS